MMSMSIQILLQVGYLILVGLLLFLAIVNFIQDLYLWNKYENIEKRIRWKDKDRKLKELENGR